MAYYDMVELNTVKNILRRRHPNWPESRITKCAKFAIDNPDWKKEKTEQSEVVVIKQISFENLMKGSVHCGC